MATKKFGVSSPFLSNRPTQNHLTRAATLDAASLAARNQAKEAARVNTLRNANFKGDPYSYGYNSGQIFYDDSSTPLAQITPVAKPITNNPVTINNVAKVGADDITQYMSKAFKSIEPQYGETAPNRQLNRNAFEGYSIKFGKGGVAKKAIAEIEGILSRLPKGSAASQAKVASELEQAAADKAALYTAAPISNKTGKDAIAQAKQTLSPSSGKDKFLEPSAEKRKMYHGSRHYPPGKMFHPENRPSGDGIKEFNQGIREMTFVSPDPEFANTYARDVKDADFMSGAVYPVHVQVRNPFDFQNADHLDVMTDELSKLSGSNASVPAWINAGQDKIRAQLRSGNWDVIEDPFVIKTAKELGFDGMYMNEQGVKNLGVFDPKKIKSAIGNRGTYDINEADITKAHGGVVHMGKGGLAKMVSKELEKALVKTPKNELIKQVETPTIIIPSKLAEVEKYVRGREGSHGANRVQYAADQIKNLERQYTEEALKQAFSGDNARALMIGDPYKFQDYAARIEKPSKGGIAEYKYFMSKEGGGADDVPYLALDRETGEIPYVSGHEGRHRNLALSEMGDENTLWRMLPRASLREHLPRRSQEEYLDALVKEIGNPAEVSPEERKGVLVRKLPEMFLKGGLASIAKYDSQGRQKLADGGETRPGYKKITLNSPFGGIEANKSFQALSPQDKKSVLEQRAQYVSAYVKPPPSQYYLGHKNVYLEKPVDYWIIDPLYDQTSSASNSNDSNLVTLGTEVLEKPTGRSGRKYNPYSGDEYKYGISGQGSHEFYTAAMAKGGVLRLAKGSQEFPLQKPAEVTEADLTPTEVNPIAGMASRGLANVHDFLVKPFGYENPPLEVATDFVGMPSWIKVLENKAYGTPSYSGSGQAIRLNEEAIDPLLTVIGGAKPAAKAVAKVTKKIAKEAAPYAANQAVNLMEKYGVSPTMNVIPPSKIVGKPAEVKAPANDLGLYSVVEKAALNLQRKSGNGDAFLSDLMKHQGVSQAKLDETGITSALKGRNGVTRDEVQQLAAEGKIPLQERVAKEFSEEPKSWQEHRDNVDRVNNKLTFYGRSIDDLKSNLDRTVKMHGDDSVIASQLRDKIKVMEDAYKQTYDELNKLNSIDLEASAAKYGPTSNPSLNTRGGENYREILIKTPENVAKPIDTSGWKVVTDDENKYSGQRAISIFDGEGNLVAKRSGYRGSDYDAINNAAKTKQKYESSKMNFDGSHHDDPNILMHLRVADHVDTEGKKGLLIDELQSDWHQKGRDKGYGKKLVDMPSMSADELYDKHFNELSPAQKEYLEGFMEKWDSASNYGKDEELNKLINQYENWTSKQTIGSGIPDAPFKDDWYQLGLKRAIKEAADSGMDRVYLTTGDTQAKRYDLSQHIDRIDYNLNEDGTYNLSAIKNGSEVLAKESLSKKEVEDLVGKDVAKKISEGEGKSGMSADRWEPEGNDAEVPHYKSLSGLDLQVGGEGMRQYYDKTYLNWLKKYAKQHGAEVGITELPSAARTRADLSAKQMHEMMDNPEFKKILDEEYAKMDTNNPSINKPWDAALQRFGGQKVYYLDLNPALKNTAEKGQAYAEGGAVEPTDDLMSLVDEHFLNEPVAFGIGGIARKVAGKAAKSLEGQLDDAAQKILDEHLVKKAKSAADDKFLPLDLPRTTRSKQQIESHAERVARQMMGEHVRDPKNPKDSANLAGRSMKEVERLKNIDYTLEKTKDLPEPQIVDPQIGDVNILTVGDITVADRNLVDVNGYPIHSTQEGGPFFGKGKLHLPDDESLWWASEESSAQNFQNRVDEIAERYGIDKLKAHHLAMGQQANNFAMHFADANLKAINTFGVPEEGIGAINSTVRNGFSAIKNGKVIEYKFPDFPGVENIDEAYKYFRAYPEARKWFNNRMKTPTLTQEYGLPNGLDIQWAITDPLLRNMEINLTGRSVGDVYKGAELTDTADHGTYGKGIRGKFQGTTRYPIPMELSHSDAYDYTAARKNKAHITGTLQKVAPHQIVDQQYLDEIGYYNDLIKKYTGKRKGGKITAKERVQRKMYDLDANEPNRMGIAPYGLRYALSASEVPEAKGKGYFGEMRGLQGGVTEYSLDDRDLGAFPSVTPNQTKENLAGINREELSDSALALARKYAAMRKKAGKSTFAQMDELRYPQPQD